MFKSVATATMFAVMLCGCAKKTIAVSNSVDAVNKELDALEMLAKDCDSQGVKTQIIAIREQVKSIQSACAVEKDNAVAKEHDKTRKWQIAFLSLVAIISLATAFRKFFKA